MKRLFLLLSGAAVLFLLACSNDNPEDSASGIKIDQSMLTHNRPAEQDTFVITVECDRVFEAVADQDWCTPTVGSGPMNNLSIMLDKNSGTEMRTAVITVSAGNYTPVTITVNQFGEEPVIMVLSENYSFNQNGGPLTIEVSANIDVDFTMPDWISRNPSQVTRAISTTSYDFTVDALEDGEYTRDGAITVKGMGEYANVIGDRTVLITQLRDAAPRFAVISDVHFNVNNATTKVTRALKNLVSKEIDAIFVVGDLTDYGQDGQYAAFKAVFNNTSIIPASVKKYYMTGNHDCYTAGFRERFTAQLGQPFDQYIELNDYPFITIGSSNTPNSGTGCYSAEQKVFLSEKLAYAAAKYPGKPIFVFMHVAPSNTAYGTNSNDGNWSSPNMNDVLSQYPQAIVFSGHSHYPLGDPRSIWQGTFTAINDGSTAYGEVEPGILTDGIHPVGNHDVTEGVIVSIEDDGDVLVERYDTHRDEKILPDWTISAPHDGTAFNYKNKTNTVSPVFGASARPVVSDITATSCTVTWPQATDDEAVFRYKIETTPTTAAISLFSGFYLNSAMPAQLSRNLTGLTAGTQYTISVIAVDSYGNQSEAIVSEPFVAE